MTLSVGALSACGGDDPDGDGSSTTTATPLDPSSSSSSSSGSESSSSSSSSGSGSSTSASAKGDAPELPAAAKEHTDDGAVAYAQNYWEALGRSQASTDTKELRGLVSDDCVPCQTLIENFDAMHAENTVASINPVSVTEAKLSSTADGKSDEAVRLQIDNAEHKRLKDGKSIGVVKASQYRAIVYLSWEGSRWTVVDSVVIT